MFACGGVWLAFWPGTNPLSMASDILAKRCDFKTLLKQDDKSLYDILKVGTSAGGAKPKAIIAYNEETGEVRSGQVEAPENFGYWLLKFDGVKQR